MSYVPGPPAFIQAYGVKYIPVAKLQTQTALPRVPMTYLATPSGTTGVIPADLIEMVKSAQLDKRYEYSLKASIPLDHWKTSQLREDLVVSLFSTAVEGFEIKKLPEAPDYLLYYTVKGGLWFSLDYHVTAGILYFTIKNTTKEQMIGQIPTPKPRRPPAQTEIGTLIISAYNDLLRTGQVKDWKYSSQYMDYQSLSSVAIRASIYYKVNEDKGTYMKQVISRTFKINQSDVTFDYYNMCCWFSYDGHPLKLSFNLQEWSLIFTLSEEIPPQEKEYVPNNWDSYSDRRTETLNPTAWN